jgi:hypothetical protein
MAYTVLCAAYGALAGGKDMEARDVTGILQEQLKINKDGLLKIDNTSMGGDPAQGHTKHFGAVVEVNGRRTPFACQEGQTINFSAPVS